MRTHQATDMRSIEEFLRQDPTRVDRMRLRLAADKEPRPSTLEVALDACRRFGMHVLGFAVCGAALALPWIGLRWAWKAVFG